MWESGRFSFANGERMNTYSLRRGRKKAVRKFTARQGLWMALMIGVATVGMLLLFLLGVFHVD